MDKQKQIEEMAHKLCKSKSPCIECLKKSRDAGIFVNKTDCECYLHAKILSKHYQPKLPEDAIIISKESYKRTVEIDVACEIAFRIVDIERNARKEALEAFIEELKKQFDRTSAVFYPTDAIEKRIDKIAKDFGIKTTERKNKKKHPNFKNHTSEPDWN